ncbi:MAG TPA: carbohydrate kinase family protein [Anaerovoracaceae bacterium]|nr:carbohydrate kinase family protein [Anaerovoracaceae bacterium]
MSDAGVIGGITADIEGHPYKQLIPGDSNPGKISMSYGGVGRNITENLARMGASVSFVSVAGDDFAGRGAVRELSDIGVNVENVRLLPEENTAVYMSILNIVGDMELGLCNMDVLERISTDFIDEAYVSIKNSGIIGIDTNLTEETLDYATRKLRDIPLFLDPVSVTKAERAKEIIGRFHTIKPNRIEAEVISGMSILSTDELEKAAAWFIGQGVKRVFITLGPGGVFYSDGQDSGLIRPAPAEAAIVSATGAGDAFSAAVIYSHLQGFNIRKTAETGMAAAAIAMRSKTAVNRQMSGEMLRKTIGMEV